MGQTTNTPSVDQNYGAAVTISSTHALTHQGKMFVMSEAVASLANSAVRAYDFTTGANSAHWIAVFAVGGDCSLEIFEAPTNVTGGTLVASYNKNRYSSKTATAVIKHTPTITTPGTTLLLDLILPGGDKKGSGIVEGFDEFIFKSNTQYLVRLTNISGGAIGVGTTFTWYENGNI